MARESRRVLDIPGDVTNGGCELQVHGAGEIPNRNGIGEPGDVTEAAGAIGLGRKPEAQRPEFGDGLCGGTSSRLSPLVDSRSKTIPRIGTGSQSPAPPPRAPSGSGPRPLRPARPRASGEHRRRPGAISASLGRERRPRSARLEGSRGSSRAAGSLRCGPGGEGRLAGAAGRRALYGVAAHLAGGRGQRRVAPVEEGDESGIPHRRSSRQDGVLGSGSAMLGTRGSIVNRPPRRSRAGRSRRDRATRAADARESAATSRTSRSSGSAESSRALETASGGPYRRGGNGTRGAHP